MRKPVMKKMIPQILALLFAAVPGVALAQAPKNGLIISNDDVQAVLQHAADIKRTTPDNMIQVIDMGAYQLGVAVIHRGKLAPVNIANVPNPPAGRTEPCGESRPGATGPGGISHNDTDETYIVTSGEGTLTLGGILANGKLSTPDAEVTRILNGRSCAGTQVGYISRVIKPGDIVVIPAGTAHGFTSIPDHITYLSLRPDLKKVLEHGYVNPALKP